jgi:hypothetical protein
MVPPDVRHMVGAKPFYRRDPIQRESHSCGGGVEYLHRSPASRIKHEKGSLESETENYGRESHVARTREWLRWREVAAMVKDRPVLSSERAPHSNKSATV